MFMDLTHLVLLMKIYPLSIKRIIYYVLFDMKVTRELLDRGVLAKEIGIITPYNSQADLIQRVFCSEVEIHTVDRYQVIFDLIKHI